MKPSAYVASLLMLCNLHSIAKDNSTNKPASQPATSFEKTNANANQFSFIENRGQITDQDEKQRADIQYTLHAAAGLNIFIGSGAIHYQFNKVAAHNGNTQLTGKFAESPAYTMYRMDVTLMGANTNARVLAEQKQAYCEHTYNTETGAGYISAHAYNKITYKDIYPHIDWVLYCHDGQLEHEFVVHKGGNLADIKLQYGGAATLKKNSDGSLTATTPLGNITEHAPYTYQVDGKKIDSRFYVDGSTVKYETENYNGEIVVDPSLSWLIIYGDTSVLASTNGASVAVDTAGNVYMVGSCNRATAIATTGAYQTTYGGNIDAYIVKYNKLGVRQWGTYYGGASGDWANGVALDAAGNLYVAGNTESTSGIATAGAFKATYSGTSYTSFLVKFNPSGTRQWATYYGDTLATYGNSVAVDESGNVYMAGNTNSLTGIASAGAYQTAVAGGSDGFIVKFNSTGTRLWGTYYGGTSSETGVSIAIDNSGNVFFGGYTTSTSGIATTGSYQATLGGAEDAYLVKFSSSGTMLWGTYYGGSGYEETGAVTTDKWGNAYISGYTTSTDSIATAGSYQSSYGGRSDAFLAKFNSSGAMQWGTYYGGSGGEAALGLAADTLGNIYATGRTWSADSIATPGAFQTTFGGGLYNAFVAKLDTGCHMLWATYYGGPHTAIGYGVAVDKQGNIYDCGETGDEIIPYEGPFSGFIQAFLLKFNTLPPITGGSHVCVGSTLHLSNTLGGGTWSSSNTAIATVGSSSGIVSGVSAGTAIVTYNTISGFVITIISVDTLPSSILFISPMCAGSQTSCSDPTPGGTWSSSNTAIATVGSIPTLITGVATGVATISYTNACGSATRAMTVNPSPAPITGVMSICVGGTTTLIETTGGGMWYSSYTPVAITGSSTGIVTGISAGRAGIGYILPDGCYTLSTVTVASTPSAITGPSTLCIGSSITLSDVVGGGTWSSSNTAIATIGSGTGIASGVSAGTVNITYLTACGSVYTTATVVASPAAISGPSTVCAGSTITLTDATSGGTWSSASPAVATVGSLTGVVTGIAAGTTSVSYALGSGCAATLTVTVTGTPIVYTVTGTGAHCAGMATVSLSGSQAGVSYQLYNGGIAVGAPMTGTGSAITFTGITTSGTYTVVANPGTSCSATMTGSAVITITAPPSDEVFVSGGSHCTGGSGIVVGLAGSQPGVNYQLYRTAMGSTVAVGSAVAGTGSAISFGLQTVAGTYTVIATNPTTGCTFTLTGSTRLVFHAPPALITVTGGGAFCSGGAGVAVGLPASAVGVNYQLYRGTTPVGSPVPGAGYAITFGLQTVPGTYTVVATDTTTGCSSTMTGSATVTMYTSPTVYSVTGGGSYCAGGTGVPVGISGSNSGINYQLYLGGIAITGAVMPGTGAAISFGSRTAAGTYTVVATNISNFCTSTMSGSAIVSVNPVPTISGSIYTVAPRASITLTGTPSGGTWASSAPAVATIGSASGVVTGVAIGTTTITYALPTGCRATHTVSTTATGHRMAHSGAGETTATNISVAPNPNKGTFSVKGWLGVDDEQDVTFEVTDMLGRHIYARKVTAYNGTIDEVIQLGNVASGTYLLTVHTDADQKVFHIIVEQ